MPTKVNLRIFLGLLLQALSLIICTLLLWRFLLAGSMFVLYQYGLVIPSVLALFGALALPDGPEVPFALQRIGFKIKMTALLMASFSPFITWYFLTSQNLPLYYGIWGFIICAYFCILDTLSYCGEFGKAINHTPLARISRLVNGGWLLLIVLPVFVSGACWWWLQYSAPEERNTLFFELLLQQEQFKGYLLKISFVGLATAAFNVLLGVQAAWDELHYTIERTAWVLDQDNDQTGPAADVSDTSENHSL